MATTGCDDRGNRFCRYLTIALATVSGAPAAACRQGPRPYAVDRMEGRRGQIPGRSHRGPAIAAARIRGPQEPKARFATAESATRCGNQTSWMARINLAAVPLDELATYLPLDEIAALSADDQVRAIADGRVNR